MNAYGVNHSTTHSPINTHRRQVFDTDYQPGLARPATRVHLHMKPQLAHRRRKKTI